MNRILLSLTISLSSLASASDPNTPAPSSQVSKLSSAIPEILQSLAPPSARLFENGIQMEVSTDNKKAQDHVIQGLNHLHGGWEFEASRHFAAAMQQDPECLMAHLGMLMALLDSSPETASARIATMDRLIYLMGQGKGNELERGFAFGLVQYFEKGSTGAAAAFRMIADRFPNDLQANVFAALFNRGGYNELGTPDPAQTRSEQQLLELIKKFPNSTVPLNALLVIRSEASDLKDSLKLAHQLCLMEPSYAPAFHLLGHYEWRSGNHNQAAIAFGRASTLYQKWMKQNQVSVADCPEWIKAECYRVVALLSMDDAATAYAAARQIAAIPLPKNRPSSPGCRTLLWDAKTLPARVIISRGVKNSATLASLALPLPADIQPYHKSSLAYWWIDGLRFALETQKLCNEGKSKEALEVATVLALHVQNMAKTQKTAALSGENSQWQRSFRALQIFTADIRGLINLTGPDDMQNLAYNWYASALEYQRPEPSLYPPLILTPMASRIGDLYLKTKRPADAISYYQQALELFPNDVPTLIGLKSALTSTGKTSDAKKIDAQIDAIKAQ